MRRGRDRAHVAFGETRRRFSEVAYVGLAGMALFQSRFLMDKKTKPKLKKKLNLKVKTLEKKTAPKAVAAMGASPVIGYS